MSENYTRQMFQKGFTLIELMISLVLGLIVTAAVIQVYIINTRTVTIQQSASEVQDSSIFAIQFIEDHVRLANLGNVISHINSNTANGGIVLTGNNVGSSSYANTGYFTASTGQTGTVGTNGWSGVSNTNVGSDQLTIQYQNIIDDDAMYDCEGAEVDEGDIAVERYFVRTESGAASTGTGAQDLVLACDAGRSDGAGSVTNFGDNGATIVQGIDQFKVLLGTNNGNGTLAFMTPATYLDASELYPITTIKLGYIMHSSTTLLEDDLTSFNVLGTANTLKSDADSLYRRSYESTITLRNARVISLVN